MRIAVEQQEANELAAQRMTAPLAAAAAANDPTSTDALRAQLGNSMANLDNRCLGVNAQAKNGSVILICGDNSGEVTNTQTRTSTYLPILMQPGTAGTSAAAVPAQSSGAPVGP